MEKQLPSPVRILMYMLKWLVITAILGVFMGSFVCFFLNSLDVRDRYPTSTSLATLSIANQRRAFCLSLCVSWRSF